jgi:hypothetical protein
MSFEVNVWPIHRVWFTVLGVNYVIYRLTLRVKKPCARNSSSHWNRNHL